MSTTTKLPPGWQPDPELAQLLPAHLDWRTFCRVREAPHRYLVCICGGGIWDIYRSTFSTPVLIGGRERYHLNPGPNAKPLRLYLARIIASLVYPASHQFNSQAHHPRRHIEGDSWENLRWQSKAQNIAVEVQRKKDALASGTEDGRKRNGRDKISPEDLALFIEHVDLMKKKRRDPHWKDWSFYLSVSTRQLRKIVAGESRAPEVAAIRAKMRHDSP
ncbi:hypothetical protein MHZ93_24240 [Roseomonas sp. ACRSG]|nr:hypothetical protein [Roseomonas sp. ACRSG]